MARTRARAHNSVCFTVAEHHHETMFHLSLFTLWEMTESRSYWVRDFFSRWSQFFYCLALLSSTVRHPSSQPHVPVGALRSHSLINHERAPLAWPHHFCPAISHNIRNENHIIVMQKVASLKPCPHSEALGRTEGTGQLICQINDTVTRWDMLLKNSTWSRSSTGFKCS